MDQERTDTSHVGEGLDGFPVLRRAARVKRLAATAQQLGYALRPVNV